MRKIFFILFFMLSMFCFGKPVKNNESRKWYEKDSRIEVVNEKTVIFKNILKIEIKTPFSTQTTWIYDIKHGRSFSIEKGSFSIDLPMGTYLIQSDKRITKANYEVIVE